MVCMVSDHEGPHVLATSRERSGVSACQAEASSSDIAAMVSKFVCYTLAYWVLVIRVSFASSCSGTIKEIRRGMAERDSYLLCCPSQPPSGSQ
jgi:hypothetical protein